MCMYSAQISDNFSAVLRNVRNYVNAIEETILFPTHYIYLQFIDDQLTQRYDRLIYFQIQTKAIQFSRSLETPCEPICKSLKNYKCENMFI